MTEPWRRRAACRPACREQATLLPIFYSRSPDDEATAKAVCADCPVRMPCLWMAIDEKLEGGIFGGATQDERDRVARQLTPRKLPAAVGSRRVG